MKGTINMAEEKPVTDTSSNFIHDIIDEELSRRALRGDEGSHPFSART